VEELDLAIRKFDEKDPAKYDFALFGLGVTKEFKIERMKKNEKTEVLEKIADGITWWIGSIQSLIVHTLLFDFFSSADLNIVEFDKMLLILTTVVSLEAIYLAIFIQMSVNKSHEKIEDIQEDIEEISEDIEDIQEDIEEISEEISEDMKKLMKILKIFRKILKKLMRKKMKKITMKAPKM
jgi:uncharacterized membrane protein